MKKAGCWIAVIGLCLASWCTMAWSQDEAATKEECMAKVSEAVKQIKSEGMAAVKPVIEKVGGPYTWKDGYVFCMDTKEGIMLAHPFLPPPLVGRPLAAMADSNGTQYIKEMLDVANRDGQGWVRYLSRRRGYRDEQLKETYVVKIPEAEVIVGAGYFPSEGQ